VIRGRSAAPEGRLDIVIVNYETPRLLDGCLGSIAAHSAGIVQEVVVVDNSRTPGGAEAVVRNHRGVRLLRPASNVGYGAAANHGVATGTAEYALVLNADAQLHPGAATALVEELDRHPEAGIVGPRLVDDQGGVQPSCARFPTPGRLLVHETGLWKAVRSTRFGPRVQPFFELDAPAVVPWVLGAALAVRRCDFDAVGGFDPKYFMYYEEVDLCRRLAARGSLTRFTPSATIGHIGGASTAQNPSPMRREMFRSLARYMRRHGRDPGLVRLRLAVVAVASARFGRDILLRSSDPTRGRWRQSLSAWRSIVADAMGGWRDG
jgi:GT2 family glycosyltransferase